jgi:HSP20 family protein
MEEINSRFNQLVRTFFGDTSGAAGAAAWSPLAPPVDVEETDSAYVVDVDLPNVNPDDVTIEMRGEELRISGKYQQREHAGVVRRQNRPVGDFEYVVDLPSDIDPNQVGAMYDTGVLTITVGKAQEAQPRRIEIRKSQGQQMTGHGGGQREARESPGGEAQPGATQAG